MVGGGGGREGSGRDRRDDGRERERFQERRPVERAAIEEAAHRVARGRAAPVQVDARAGREPRGRDDERLERLARRDSQRAAVALERDRGPGRLDGRERDGDGGLRRGRARRLGHAARGTRRDQHAAPTGDDSPFLPATSVRFVQCCRSSMSARPGTALSRLDGLEEG